MRIFLLILMIALSTSVISAQSVFSGSVKNKSGEPIMGTITVQAKNSHTVAGFSRSNAKGEYTINYEGEADSITLTISSMLVGKHSKIRSNKSQRVDFVINEQALKLKEVTVNAFKIKRNKDTLDYLVGAYTDQNDRVIGDALRKMPGIDVAESGKISFNGQNVSKFYVENMDLLQGKYGLATNNIPVKAVSVIQVLENHQPIKALRGKLPTNDIAINLKLKDSAKGVLTITGLLGGGYQPILWNAELTAMYFGKKKQNMTLYKGNNTGDNVASEFLTHYDYERVYISPNSPLHIQMPATPPVPRKRYIDNRSHAVTSNHLIKPNENTEVTTSALYYDDRIQKEGYSLYEQYLPSNENMVIEEQISSVSHIHNAEVASRVKVNGSDQYLNNALNLQASWNSDLGTGTTSSSIDPVGVKIDQHLNQPFISIDNTFNYVKTVKKNIYKVYFSAGYGQKAHTLTVSPVTYWGEEPLESLSQDLLARDLASVLRLSYGLNWKNFRLDYALWGRADIQHLDTELTGKGIDGQIDVSADSLRNNLWYNTYQVGVSQSYMYDKNNFKVTLDLPLVYYRLAEQDKIPHKEPLYNRVNISPSVTVKYEYLDFIFSAAGNAGRSFGDMTSSYTGFIMHGYRSLLRNSVDQLFESRFYGANAQISYKNIFEALFLNLGANYRKSWKSLLYGYNYEGIMSVKTVVDHPTEADSYGIRFNGSKGLNFWSGTLRLFGNYNGGSGQQLIQNEVLNAHSRSNGAGTNLLVSPVSFLSLNYTFSWNKSQSYVAERSSDFPAIQRTSHVGGLNIFPTKAVTINLNVEHQYNSVASERYTTFSDAKVKWKNKRVDIELEVNNIFNAKQYVSASYSDVSTYYYSYNLRPVSALVKFRFKLK